jgi:hypothetical protein
MRLKLLLALSLVGQIGLAPLSAQAGTITYSTPTDKQAGRFEGELPIQSIGSVKLPSGKVQFKGEDVNIFAVPDWLFDPNLVLSGALVRAEFASPANNSSRAIIGGLAYFLAGEWLSNLAPPRAIDVVETLSGEEIRGRILSRIGSAFAIKPENGATRKVEFSEIKTINSPRAFRFSILTTSAKIAPNSDSLSVEADKISFSPTFLHGGLIASKPVVPKSTLAGSDPGIRKSTIATFLALDIAVEAAPAIAIPLVLNRSTQVAALKQQNLFVSEQQRAAGIPVPLNFSNKGDNH